MDTYEGEKDKRDICYGIINYIKRSNGRDHEFKNTKLLCEMIDKLSSPQSIKEVTEYASKHKVELNYGKRWKEAQNEATDPYLLHYIARGEGNSVIEIQDTKEKKIELERRIEILKPMVEHLSVLNDASLTESDFKNIVEMSIYRKGAKAILPGNGMFISRAMCEDINNRIRTKDGKYQEGARETGYIRDYELRQRDINDFLQTIGEGGYSDSQLEKMIGYVQKLYPDNLMNVAAVARGLSPEKKEEFLKKHKDELIPQCKARILCGRYIRDFLIEKGKTNEKVQGALEQNAESQSEKIVPKAIKTQGVGVMNFFRRFIPAKIISKESVQNAGIVSKEIPENIQDIGEEK